MGSRRLFARTATDISLRPPHKLGFSSFEQDVDPVFSNEQPGSSTDMGFSGPVHVVSYLTPHKVSVLALVELYCQAQYPMDLSQRLSFFLLKCIQDPEEYIQRDIQSFGSQVSLEVGSLVWDHLRSTLKRIESPHHLEDFFLRKLEEDGTDPDDTSRRRVGLMDLVVPSDKIMSDSITIELDPGSIIGLYVRKAQLEYRKLEFEEMCTFFTAFRTYMASIDKGKNKPIGGSSDHPSTLSKDPIMLSTFDMDKYLDLQTQKLSNPGQDVIPEDLMVHVRNIQSRMPTLAKTHYITCLNAQQTGDFEVAIQSLYRFFDYSVMHDRVLYQYALLNLAMLHARFYHYEQAVTALREAIEVARDHMDQECLSYALNWLHRLTGSMPSAYSETGEGQALANADERSNPQPFHYLRSLSELAVAKQMQGESMPKALDAIVKASSISLRHSLDGVNGVAHLFQSRIWSSYGSASLSSLHSQLQLQYYPSDIDITDGAYSYAKTASDLALDGRFEDSLSVIELAKKKFPLKTMKATPWVQALVQILLRRALATNQLRDAEIWAQQLGVTLVNTSLPAAPSDSSTSKESGPSQQNQLDDTSREIQLEIILQKALLSVLRGQRLSGVQQLSEGLAIVRQNQWPGVRKFTVMYLVALAEIYMDSDSAISAVPLLLTALTLSEHNLQRPLLLLVKLRLSEVLLHLDSIQQANDLVDSVMTVVLTQGDVFVHAMAYFQKAKCILAQANRTEPSTAPQESRLDQLEHVKEHLERALDGFKQAESLKEVIQVLYFQVRVYRELASAGELEATLRLYKTSSMELSAAKNKHEPSWYSFYYARDVFEGVLKSKGDSHHSGHPTLGHRGSSPNQGQGQLSSTGSMKRVGSTQGGGLKRTPSQLWRTTTAQSYSAPLSPHHERDEETAHQSYERTEDDDDGMDVDIDSSREIESQGTKPGEDDAGAGPSQTKKRRIVE